MRRRRGLLRCRRGVHPACGRIVQAFREVMTAHLALRAGVHRTLACVSRARAWLRSAGGEPVDATGVEAHDAPGGRLDRGWRRTAQGPSAVLAPAAYGNYPGSDDWRTHDDCGNTE